MAETDLTLARRGDPAAFERLVTPHLQGLFGFLRKRLGDMAEDAYQETLLAAWQALPGFREGATLKTWLFAIAGYKCVDCIRRNAREGNSVLLEEGLQGEGFEEGSNHRMQVRDALDSLDGEEQALLYLVFTQGLTQKEAAGVLGIPEGTVKSRLYTLKNKLRKQLGGEGIGY